MFDPFVGSGSVLVSCAHFGAHVAGADYDPRVFVGDEPENQSVKGKKWCCCFSNLVANHSHHSLQLILSIMDLDIAFSASFVQASI